MYGALGSVRAGPDLMPCVAGELMVREPPRDLPGLQYPCDRMTNGRQVSMKLDTVSGLVLMVVVCMASLGPFLAGCEETPDAAAQKAASASVNEAGRLLRASHQSLAISKEDIRSAADAGPGSERQWKQQAKRVLDRLERNAGFGEFEQALNEVDAMVGPLEKPEEGDSDARATISSDDHLQQIASSLLRADEALQAGQSAVAEAAKQENRRRLKRTENSLKAAIKMAEHAERSDTVIGPQLVLGTLQLTMARDRYAALRRHDVLLQVKQGQIARLYVALVKLQAEMTEAETFLPTDAVAALRLRLNGGGGQAGVGLVDQLAEAEKAVVYWSAEKEKLDAAIEGDRQKALQFYREHLSAVEQAEHTRGQERFELRQQAYESRVGRGEGGEYVPGGLYYEAQSELAESRLAVVENRLTWAIMRRDQLKQLVANVQAKLQELPSTRAALDAPDIRSENTLQRTELVSEITNLLKQLQDDEETYNAMRVDAVDAYDPAIEQFSRAARVRGVGRKTKQHAEKLAQTAGTELAQLWHDDATHYDMTANAISIVSDVAELADTVGQMRRDYVNKAEQARASAARLAADDQP